MKSSFKIGICFGLTSGIITTLGLMIGLHSGTHSALAVIGGVLTIAIADAFSDALGMHISQESEHHRTPREVWESTSSTFFTKLVFALTFVIPVLLFYNSLGTAMIISIAWGLLGIGILSFIIAAEKKEKVWRVVTEHVGITLVVIVIAHFAGDMISVLFH